MKAKFSMTRQENIFWAKRNVVDYIWKSANLEGIGVTYPDTQAICAGMSVAGYTIEDINAVNDLKHAWHFLLENIDAELDIEYIKKAHIILGKFTVINSGIIRSDEVRIGGTEWKPDIPDENKIKNDIDFIMRSGISELEKALDMMLYLMRAQLFIDGNKRLSMLIGNKIMIENGQGIISVSQKDIKAFYDLLIAYYESGDRDGIKRFLYDNCIDGMRKH